MISLGFEYATHPTKEEIREWKKWQKEMKMLLGAAPLKQQVVLRKKKTTLSKRKHGV
ncbi:MAG: hypothetical protein HY840_04250 [Bacteroidetes bacterium]|nr:hypothetical protein [Bacteroidota bacterium]